MGEPSIVFVSREVYPLDSAGLGNYVSFVAEALAAHANVSIVTTDVHEATHARLQAAADPRLPEGVEFHFVAEPTPEQAAGWYGQAHLWSARALDAVSRIHPGGGPSLVEFPDYLGEGCVAVQAARTLDPRLRASNVVVRLYTSAEICAVLNGSLSRAWDVRSLHALERYALRHADHVVWPGGDVLGTYERFYGWRPGRAATMIRHPISPSTSITVPEPGDGPLRFIYVGRLERRKGVQNLIRAFTSIPGYEWSLTLVGGDTDTAPLGVSMREQLATMIAGDPRIALHERVPRERVRELVADADVFVSPSLWECWPNTVLEAFELNRPVLATPVGGHLEMVEAGGSGWLARNTTADALADSIEALIANPAAPREMSAAGGPRRAFERLTDADQVREAYLALCRAPTKRASAERPRGAAPPLVSVVIPYFRMHRYVEEAVASVEAQTYSRLEIIGVNDGSFETDDAVLEAIRARGRVEVVNQTNSGLSQARNLGIDLSAGRYVLPLDPDDVLLPSFVERSVEVLESNPEIAYVSAWSRYVGESGAPLGNGDQGYRPLGNDVGCLEMENMAGPAMSLFRRRIFERGMSFSPDMTSYEDWLLFRQLATAGHRGHVIPEVLLLYRVRARSMLRTVGERRLERLQDEIEARLREGETAWMPSSA